MICKAAETAIEPRAAQRKMSEGNFAVCSSMARATLPSLCCGFTFVAIMIIVLRVNYNDFNFLAMKEGKVILEEQSLSLWILNHFSG
jgi:hypothetical protein